MRNDSAVSGVSEKEREKDQDVLSLWQEEHRGPDVNFNCVSLENSTGRRKHDDDVPQK